MKVIVVGDDNQFKPISAGDCFKKKIALLIVLEYNKIAIAVQGHQLVVADAVLR